MKHIYVSVIIQPINPQKLLYFNQTLTQIQTSLVTWYFHIHLANLITQDYLKPFYNPSLLHSPVI